MWQHKPNPTPVQAMAGKPPPSKPRNVPAARKPSPQAYAAALGRMR